MNTGDYLLSRHHFRQLEEEFPLAVLREVPQRATPLHRHDFCECAFIMAGRGWHVSEDHPPIPIRHGDVLVIPRGGHHAYVGAEEELDVCNLLFDTTRLPTVLLELYSDPVYKRIFLREHPSYGKEDFPLCHPEEAVFSELVTMLRYLGGISGASGRHCYKLGLFMAIISRLCSVWKVRRAEVAPPLDIRRITEYLERHFRREIYLDDLCGLAAMSRATLLRHFRSALGVTPMVYLRNLRLQRVAELLLHSDLGLQQIAEQSGFSQMPYFYRAFRACYGTSPGEYRKKR